MARKICVASQYHLCSVSEQTKNVKLFTFLTLTLPILKALTTFKDNEIENHFVGPPPNVLDRDQ